jgi:hypothetical protein
MTDSERDRLDDLKARLDLPGMKQVSVQEVRDALDARDAEITRLREERDQERAARERAEAALAALNAVSRWRPIESAPEQKDVLGTAKIDGEWVKPVLIYYEPYKRIGWVCARTHQPVRHQPTMWAPTPGPPTDV